MRISETRSPMGYYYKYDKTETAGQRLARRIGNEGKFGVGEPDFSIQAMTADELYHIADFLRTVWK